jgi:hypothetical protein
MPAYQGLPSLDAVKYKRVLFGGFPCYSSTTPLGPGFDRVLQLGDASASQSPLSFGGFGSMLRHLRRLSGAIGHALQDDKLSRQDLSWIHPYQPSLSAAWLFQRSMSMQVGQQQQQQQQQHKMPSMQQHLGDAAALGVAGTAAAAAAGHEKPAAAATGAMSAVATGAGAAAAAPATPDAATTTTSSKPSWLQQLLKLPANHINALLGANFAVMAFLGQRVMKPFLQDTLQLGPLAATMFGMMLVKPLVISRVLVQVRIVGGQVSAGGGCCGWVGQCSWGGGAGCTLVVGVMLVEPLAVFRMLVQVRLPLEHTWKHAYTVPRHLIMRTCLGQHFGQRPQRWGICMPGSSQVLQA